MRTSVARAQFSRGDRWTFSRMDGLRLLATLDAERVLRQSAENIAWQHVNDAERAVQPQPSDDLAALIDGLSRAYDIVKPEPGMGGPHGGYIGGVSREKAAMAIDRALEHLAALAAAPTPAIDRPDMEAVRASIAAEVRDRTALLDARLAGLRKAAQAIVDGWDESLRLWQAAAQEDGNDGPAMDAIRDPARETRRVSAEEALRAALAPIAAAPKEEPTREDIKSLRRQLAAVDKALGCVEGDQFSGWVEDGGRVARITRLMALEYDRLATLDASPAPRKD